MTPYNNDLIAYPQPLSQLWDQYDPRQGWIWDNSINIVIFCAWDFKYYLYLYIIYNQLKITNQITGRAYTIS